MIVTSNIFLFTIVNNYLLSVRLEHSERCSRYKYNFPCPFVSLFRCNMNTFATSHMRQNLTASGFRKLPYLETFPLGRVYCLYKLRDICA